MILYVSSVYFAYDPSLGGYAPLLYMCEYMYYHHQAEKLAALRARALQSKLKGQGEQGGQGGHQVAVKEEGGSSNSSVNTTNNNSNATTSAKGTGRALPQDVHGEGPPSSLSSQARPASAALSEEERRQKLAELRLAFQEKTRKMVTQQQGQGQGQALLTMPVPVPVPPVQVQVSPALSGAMGRGDFNESGGSSSSSSLNLTEIRSKALALLNKLQVQQQAASSSGGGTGRGGNSRAASESSGSGPSIAALISAVQSQVRTYRLFICRETVWMSRCADVDM